MDFHAIHPLNFEGRAGERRGRFGGVSLPYMIDMNPVTDLAGMRSPAGV